MIIGKGPKTIGDRAAFTMLYAPPAIAPSALVSAVQVQVYCDFTGTTVDDTAGASQIASNSWAYTATTAITHPGRWVWKVTATGTLVDAETFSTVIDDDPISDPP